MKKAKWGKQSQRIEDFFKSNPEHGFKASFIAQELKCKIDSVYQFKYRNKDKVEKVSTGEGAYYLLKVDQQN